MSHSDLDAANAAARYLASTATTIKALPEAGASVTAVKSLLDELNQRYDEARSAIDRVRMELRPARPSVAKLGGFASPSAHEAAIEMVHELNRQMVIELGVSKFNVQIVGRKTVQDWPDAREVLAEIELETAWAKGRREERQLEAKPADTHSNAPQYVTRDQIAAIVGKSKDTVANWFNDDPKAPEPSIEGGGGKAHAYIWADIRAWLQNRSARILPQRYPSTLPPS